MNDHRLSLRRVVGRCAAVAAVAGLGLSGVPQGAQADDPVPGSCKVHPTKVVNPGCVPALSDAVGETADALVDTATGYQLTYPDLVPNVTAVSVERPIFWDFENETIGYGPPELAFDTHAQNLGTVPLDLLSDDATDVAGSNVSQCVAWTTNYGCRERRTVGGFTWHAEHSHFHFEDFGHYQMRRVLPDNTPDYSASGLVAVSEKVSFCLIDSMRVRDDAFPLWRYWNCSAINQGISPGWTDIYGSSLPGQQFPLTGVADGRYAIVVDMDTANHVFEANEANNRVELIVDVRTSPDSAVIVSRRHP